MLCWISWMDKESSLDANSFRDQAGGEDSNQTIRPFQGNFHC